MVERTPFEASLTPAGHQGGTVTLIEGSAFCISAASGDILPGTPQGLFFRDTRFLSRFEVRVNGHRPEALSSEPVSPFAGAFVLRAVPRSGQADSGLVIFRTRYVGRGIREDVVVQNFGEEAAFCSIEIRFGADFADPTEVREGHVAAAGDVTLDTGDSELRFASTRNGVQQVSRLTLQPKATVVGDQAVFEFVVAAGARWKACVQLTPTIGSEEVRPRYLCGAKMEGATPQARLDRWRRDLPAVQTDHEGLRAAVAHAAEDLGALRIFDPGVPERAVVAAGAPWFMALFGRESLLTSWMALVVDPDLALGVLQTLARLQGETVNPLTDEEPGRILHEVRFDEAASLDLVGGRASYGTADATALFIMLLGELRRWGLVPELVDRLLPHADRALHWIEHYGTHDDGLAWYKRASDRGALHQGWKHSANAIRFADGRLARPPIALAEVQGYTYSAYLARAHFAEEAGDGQEAHRLREKAAALKARFNTEFWLEDRGYFAMGLDADRKPIDALASNMGHCLWTGIVDTGKAKAVADHLLGDDLFSGWGVRTLAQSMEGYNPVSYHNGSVWPHDNAICAAGLMRYGFVGHSHRVIMGMLDAASALGHRLPELFAGIARSEVPFPVRYPSSCAPQACAAASSLMFLRTLLRLDPWVPHGKVWLSPALPKGVISTLRVERIPLAGRVTVDVTAAGVSIEGLSPNIEVIDQPRDPMPA